MNFTIIIYILGYVLKVEGLAMLVPFGVGLLYGEKQAFAFLAVAAATFLAGLLLGRKKPANQLFFAKEGFVAVALSWILMSLFGCLPFIINRDIPRFIDAFFETVSGFSTTGASILNDVDALAHCSLFWRSATHFIGGMGVLVLILCVLPMAGGASMHLMRAESPGPQVGKVVPKIRDTAIYLYAIYTAMTITEMVLLLISGMPVFDSVTIALGTAGTGGFAVRSSGFSEYSAAAHYIIAAFMILFGVNFNVYFLAVRRRFRQALRCEEVRWYLGVIASAIVLILLNLNAAHFFPTLEETFRHTLFQVGSLVSSTGFSTTDFNLFPAFSKVVLVLMMFIGACAGSTGGGIKVARIVLWGKSAVNELSRLVHPRRVKKVQFEGKPVDEGTLRSVNTYMIAFAGIYVISMLLISLDGKDFTTTFTSVIATLNNIGPGLEGVGAAENFAHFSGFSKLVFCFNMLAGRLELFPMLVFLSPGTWRQAFIKKRS